MGVDINEVEYSDWVLAKVNQKHSWTIDDVFDVLEQYETAFWDDDLERGRRLLVTGRDRWGRKMRVFLYPIDEEAGTFRLGTTL